MDEYVGQEMGRMCLTGGTDVDGYCLEAYYFDYDKTIDDEYLTVECTPGENSYCFPYSEDNRYVYFDSGFLNTMIPLGHSNYYDCHCVKEDVGGCLLVGSKYWTNAMELYSSRI